MGLPSPDHIEAKTPTAAEGLPVLRALPCEEPDQACIEAFGHERRGSAAATQTPFSAVPFKDGSWAPRRAGSLARSLELHDMASINLDSPRGKEESVALVAAEGRDGGEGGAAAAQDVAGPLLPRRHAPGTRPGTLRDRELSWTGNWVFAGRRAAPPEEQRSPAQHYSQVDKEDGPS